MTFDSRKHSTALRVAVGVALLVTVGCADGSRAPIVPTAPQLARAPSGPAVNATTPPYGDQGQSGEQVTITGSGFAPGAVASWERSGVATAKIVVRQTTFVSSTQLIATIDIASDADLAFYDVAVTNSDRKKGIGTELFEVTTAVNLGSLGGNTNANAGNDNTEAVGYSVVSGSQRAFYWSAATGMINLGGSDALGIDQAGTTIVGAGSQRALVWTRSGAGWTSAALPMDVAAVDARAAAVASDPVTGVASLIGGSESFPVKHSNYRRPRLWRSMNSGWQKIDLTMPYENVSGSMAWVNAVNASGQAVGAVGQGGTLEAIVWEADGTYTVIGQGYAQGINGAGTLIAASTSTTAVYYKRNAVGDPWTGPLVLPGGCSNAMAADDAGHILARRCPVTGSSRLTSAVFAPPYTSPVYLGGLGDVTEGGTAYGMSPGGAYIYGTSPTKPTRVAVRWQNPF